MKKVVLLGLLILLCFRILPSLHQLNDSGKGQSSVESEWSPEVKKTQGPTGHNSITIDDSESEDVVSFGVLAGWDYSPVNSPELPSALKELDGKHISIAGFMFPLVEGEKVKSFCLMVSTQTCCYGPKPQYNQFILVESPAEVPFERLRPVKVAGTFVIDPQPQEGYIFRMTADSVILAASQKVEMLTDASAAVNASGSLLFPWTDLETLIPGSSEDLGSVKIPSSIQDLNQKMVVVGGFPVGEFQQKDGTKVIIVGHNAWDGCCTGVPPSIFNSMLVQLGSRSAGLDSWVQQATFTGILTVNPSMRWMEEGLVNVRNAQQSSGKG